MAVLLATRSATATEPADERAGCFERNQYDACFREGKRQYAAGAIEQAYRAYLQGWDLRRNYEVAGNLGNVELELGKHAAAYTHLKYSLENLPPSKRTSEIVARLEQKIREALRHVGARKLAVEPQDVSATLDGKLLAIDADLWLAFAPGKYSLRVEREGYEVLRRTLEVRAGEEVVVELALFPKKADPVEGEERGMSSTRLGVGLAGVGLGVAGGVASVVLGVMSIGKAEDADGLRAAIASDPAAPRENPCGAGTVVLDACAELADAVDAETTLRNTAIGLGVASGAVLIGSILYLTLPIDDGVEVRASSSGLLLTGRF